MCICMPLSLLIVGLRGYVEVTNDLNVPANFQWHAREGVDTTVFYMVHPNGMFKPAIQYAYSIHNLLTMYYSHTYIYVHV